MEAEMDDKRKRQDLRDQHRRQEEERKEREREEKVICYFSDNKISFIPVGNTAIFR